LEAQILKIGKNSVRWVESSMRRPIGLGLLLIAS